MNVAERAVQGTKALATVGWQLSVVPAQLLGRRMPPRGSAAFYALVAGTAVVGAVDWPVALLVTGAYLAARGQAPSPASSGHAAPSPVAEEADLLTEGFRAEESAIMADAVLAEALVEEARVEEALSEPWFGYATANATEIISHLDAPGVDLDAVLQYETLHRDRKTVLAAATERQHQRSSAVPR